MGGSEHQPVAMRAVAVVVLTLAALLLFGADARAAVTAGAFGDRFIYFTVTGTDADESVMIAGPFGPRGEEYFSVSSPEGAVAEDSFCEAWTSTEIHCRARYPLDGFSVRLGDGDDELFLGDYTPDYGVGVSLGAGDDTAVGSTGRDQIEAGPGADVVHGGDGNDELSGADGADRLFGGRGYDELSGNAGPDRLFGGRAPDELWGGSGRDRLVGGGGEDELTGGAGIDRFDGGRGRDVLDAADGRRDRSGRCGNGIDSAAIDHGERPRFAHSCELIHFPR